MNSKIDRIATCKAKIATLELEVAKLEAEIQADTLAPIREAMRPTKVANDLTDAALLRMAENAKAIRAALEPFDHQ